MSSSRTIAERSGALSARLFILGTLLVGVAVPRTSAAAPIVVGTGTPESCTEFALLDALNTASSSNGGKIRFACGGGPVTIALSLTSQTPDGFGLAITLPDRTIVDGGGLITFVVNENGIAFFVDSNTSAKIENVTIYPRNPGAILNLGTLVVEQANFVATGFAGAVINWGDLRMKNSSVVGGLQTYGVANYGTASARINRSLFSDRSYTAIYNDVDATLDVLNSVFSRNGYDMGGAILGSGTITVDNCEFSDNRVAIQAGAIMVGGSLTIKDSTFTNNHSGGPGPGAVYVFGTAVVKNSQFLGNTGGTWGGAIASDISLTMKNVTISGNTAGQFGGGIFNSGSLTINDSSITGNSVVQGDGGGIYLTAGASLRLKHTQVSGNTPSDVSPHP